VNHVNVILTPVSVNRNPFIYLNNMGKVMTSPEAMGARARTRTLAIAAAVAGGIALACAFPIGSEARAETGAWAEAAHARVRLIAAVPATGAAQRVQLGLEIQLDPGWKTYWRSPGEGGMPPRFDWSSSANLESAAVAWPAPRRFEIGGMESVGYSNHVILPVAATLAQPGEPLAVRLSLHYAVCREICMLVEAKLALDLPGGAQQTAGSQSNTEAIARFQARVPRPGAAHGWSIAAVSRKQVGDGAERRDLVVIDVASSGVPFASPDLILEAPGIRFGKAMMKPAPAAGQIRFYAPMKSSGAPGRDLVLTLVDGERAGTFTVVAPR
jgi:suppressor for copper-sensitivity B